MATARLRRVLSGVRSRTLNPSALGGYDRTHDGLVSGWFICPECGTPPSLTPDLLVNGRLIAAAKASTPRGDVPGHQGFLLRFTPTNGAQAHIRVQCPAHPVHGLDLDVPDESWDTPALAAIESSSWPIVTGWLALIDPEGGDVTLDLGDGTRVPVRATVPRPDVQAYLGATGVGGFHVDLGLHHGYAIPDGTPVRLRLQDQVLAEASVAGSPLPTADEGCLAEQDASPVGAYELESLRSRFQRADVVGPFEDWRHVLADLGFEDHGAEAEQWAAFLVEHGLAPYDVAARLALRAVSALGVPALDPLPEPWSQPREITWFDPAAGWAASLIAGVEDSAGETSTSATPERKEQQHDLQADQPRVVVAGLVHHRSGLGQNARHSLTAFERAGVHACPAPFFPARGGWSPALGPGKGVLASMGDCAVLLHLPVDRVITALAAQPALLATDRLIGYFMWETAVVPKQFRRALDVVDEIWTASEFVAEAFRQVSDTPVRVTGHAVDVSAADSVARASLGIDEDAFVVHYAFDANSTIARKNPSAAIDAFLAAFGDDPGATLVLKVRNMQQADWLARSGDSHAEGLLARLAGHPRIRLIAGEASHGQALGLIKMADCFLSLHRSEGFGYGIAEAMALGTPVVATDYSGSTDLTTQDTAWLVPCEQVPVLPGEYFHWEPGMSWADPDVAVAADLLREVRAGDTPVRSKTVAARERVESVASMAALSARYAMLINDTGAGGPHD